MSYVANMTRRAGDPRVLQTGPSSLSSADRLGRALGWFSIGLGVMELLAPRLFARSLGMRRRRGLVLAYGVREVGAGILSLSVDKQAGLWSRVGGDLLDLTTLGMALHPRNRKSGNVKLALALVFSVTALDLLAAQSVTVRHTRGQPRTLYRDRSGFPKGVTAAKAFAPAE
jgi:hypothetical protein